MKQHRWWHFLGGNEGCRCDPIEQAIAEIRATALDIRTVTFVGGRISTPLCSTLCDPDCEADCHAGHYVWWKKDHPDGQCNGLWVEGGATISATGCRTAL